MLKELNDGRPDFLDLEKYILAENYLILLYFYLFI